MNWHCYYPTVDDPLTHVVPELGPQHELTEDCWCWPERDCRAPQVLVHNVAH